MGKLELSDHAVKLVASREGVCVRPVLRRVTDRATGESAVRRWTADRRWSQVPCVRAQGSSLRITQCTEGWHLAEEPEPPHPTVAADDATPEEDEFADADSNHLEDDPPHEDGAGSRWVRSTRRLEGMPELPQQAVADRTVGTVFTAPDGKAYRPSMFVTLTLDSYDRIQPGKGVPARPERYDCRPAALDALHFPKLMDRWLQNLRRAAGYRVQYFGAIEAQMRLAPHFHVALRGAIPRATVKAVTRATYLALWWPQMKRAVYVERTPVWADGHYRDPNTGWPLPTWDEALADVDADPAGEPAHVATFGRQADVKGILAGTKDSDRAVRYLTKYLTKSVADTTDDDQPNPAYGGHIDRLHEQVRWLPCTPECANWLRYGTQPRNPGPGLIPGHCTSKAHDREHLGLGGRRVLVSHADPAITLRVYAHVLRDQAIEVAQVASVVDHPELAGELLLANPLASGPASGDPVEPSHR